jgi:hypothetical protein
MTKPVNDAARSGNSVDQSSPLQAVVDRAEIVVMLRHKVVAGVRR